MHLFVWKITAAKGKREVRGGRGRMRKVDGAGSGRNGEGIIV